ncbi:hypothetical protein [Pseudomonas syringae]|uniref:hypothetical protein n=1 Tax=Pseudomonas syringae TaxID=317 RepID=UPI003204F442
MSTYLSAVLKVKVGYFYNKSTGEVISLSLGSDMVDFLEGRKKPEWKSFSDFLEHFFELSTNE